MQDVGGGLARADAAARVAGAHGKALLHRDLPHRVDRRIAAPRGAVLVDQAQLAKAHDLVEQPQLPLIALRLDARVHVLQPAVLRAGDDARADRVAGGRDDGGHRRAQRGHVLPGPGAHGDDQVDVLTLDQTHAHLLPDGRTRGLVEVGRLPIGVADELDGLAARVARQELPELAATQILRDRRQADPAQFFQPRGDRPQDPRVVVVVAAFVVADAPLRAVRLGHRRGRKESGLGRPRLIARPILGPGGMRQAEQGGKQEAQDHVRSGKRAGPSESPRSAPVPCRAATRTEPGFVKPSLNFTRANQRYGQTTPCPTPRIYSPPRQRAAGHAEARSIPAAPPVAQDARPPGAANDAGLPGHALLAQALIGVLSLSALNRQITDMTADRLEVAARQIGGRIENGCAWESRWASTSGWPGICTTASRRPRTWAARPSIY